MCLTHKTKEHKERNVLDREQKAEPYFVYLRKLIREEFSGKVTISFFKGGIRNLNKKTEPLSAMEVEESIILEQEKPDPKPRFGHWTG